MAVILTGEEGAGSYLSRTSGPTATSFSASFWVKFTSLSGVYYARLGQLEKIAITTENAKLGWSSNSSGGVGATTVDTTSWYHIGWTRNGDTQLVYLNGTQELSFSDSNSATIWFLERTSFVGYGHGGRYAHLKLWDSVVLTGAEIQQEMWAARPIRGSGLWAWYPFVDSYTADKSGNARDWTAGASPTLGDGPPVGWGASPYIIGNPAAGRVIGPGTIWPTVTM